MRAIQLAQIHQLRLMYGIAHIALELLALHLAGPAQQRPRYLEYETSLTLPDDSLNFFQLPSKTPRKLKEAERKLKETPGKLKKLVFFELLAPGWGSGRPGPAKAQISRICDFFNFTRCFFQPLSTSIKNTSEVERS